MTENYIQLKKKRSAGDILSDTFKFLRENYKPLLGLLLTTAGPLFLVLGLSLTYYTYTSSEGIKFFTNNDSFDGSTTIIAFIIFLLSLLLFYASVYGTVLNYIKSYADNNGVVNEEEVKMTVREQYGNYILLFLLVGIITIAGIILLVIPGIYVSVPLTLAICIMVFQNRSITQSISVSFDLVKDEWWNTLGNLMLIGIVVYMIGVIFQIPSIIYMLVKMMTSSKEIFLSEPGGNKDWIMILLNVFGSLVQYLLTIITSTAIALIYYNLNERKNLTGTYETIDNLGN